MARHLLFSLLLGLATLTAVVGFAPVATAQAAMKIAIVDPQRAIDETEDGIKAQATLKKLFDQRQKEISKREQDLKVKQDKLVQERTKLNQQEFEARMTALQQEVVAFQQMYMQYQQELAKKQAELLDPIQKTILAIIRRIASQDGYDAVIAKAAVAFARADMDITDRVISLYNQERAGKK